MKFLKSLTDWKTWVFTIIPFILCIAAVGIGIYAVKKETVLVADAIIAFLLLVISATLPLGRLIFMCFKEGKYIRGSISVLLVVGYLCVVGVSSAKIPKILRLENERDELYEIWMETPYEDETYQQKRQAWWDKTEEVDDIHFSFRMVLWVSSLVVYIGNCFIANPNKKKDSDNAEELEQSQGE